MFEATISINHSSGLHARPLAAFVKLAKSFASEVQVHNLTNGKGPMNGKSPVHLLMLTAQQGHVLRIATRGADGEEALKSLVRLIELDFAQESSHDIV